MSGMELLRWSMADEETEAENISEFITDGGGGGKHSIFAQGLKQVDSEASSEASNGCKGESSEMEALLLTELAKVKLNSLFCGGSRDGMDGKPGLSKRK